MKIEVRRVVSWARSAEGFAAAVGIVVVLAAALALHEAISGGPGGNSKAAPPRTTASAPHTTGPPPVASVTGSALVAGHRVSGAPRSSGTQVAEAATTDLFALERAASAVGQQARSTVAAVTTGPLRTELERALPPLADRIHARLIGATPPASFNTWPLGFKVDRLGGSVAEVSIWHLDVAASSAPRLIVARYTTTTYRLQWVGGSWRIENVSTVDGPTPSSADAPASQVDAFAHAANAFSRYRYDP
jgi:hypothetical protein